MRKANTNTNTPNAGGYTCCYCKEQFLSRSFYKSDSDFYAGVRHLPICKVCMGKLFDLYTTHYKSRKKAMQRICIAYDIYYNDTVFANVANDDSMVIIGNYLKKLNTSTHRGKNFSDCLEEGFSFRGIANNPSGYNEEDDFAVDEQLVMKWGSGFSAEDYEEMELHYTMLKKNNPDVDNNQEIFITSLCHLHMFMMKALKNDDLDGYTKANDQYSKIFTKAGLKTVEEAEVGSDDCFGVWTDIVERYTPAEYYKDKTLFKDFEGIGDYIERHLLRPLRNLQHGTKDRDREYCVKDDTD